MNYKQITEHFGIPVVGWKDHIHPDVEMRKYTIIENMLIAGTQGLSEVVFDDGSYYLDEDGGKLEVRLLAGGNYPSAQGIVGGFYFHAPAELKWKGLKTGQKNYLYLRATPKTPYLKSSIRTMSSTTPLGKGALLMATIDLSKETPELNTEPDGKVYSSDVARHASDSSSPHGRHLIQEELSIEKKLTFQEGATVQVGGTEVSQTAFAATVAELAGRKVERLDFVSGGSQGTLLKASGKVFSVDVHRRVSGPFKNSTVGEVGIGYFGEDSSVDSIYEFAVYNTGDEGIPMSALIVCG